METFWKWLMHTNARGVFCCSLSALVLVTGWWTWKEFAPVENDGLVSPIPAPGKEKPLEGLNLLAFLDKQLSVDAANAPSGAFLSPPSSLSRSGKLKKPHNPRTSGHKTRPGPEAADHKPRPGQSNKAPKPVTVSLTYRGVFKRPDGRIMALIEDSKTESSSFYLAGNNLYGLKIGDIEMEQVDIIRVDGSSVSLKLGEPEVFEEGEHAD